MSGWFDEMMRARRREREAAELRAREEAERRRKEEEERLRILAVKVRESENRINVIARESTNRANQIADQAQAVMSSLAVFSDAKQQCETKGQGFGYDFSFIDRERAAMERALAEVRQRAKSDTVPSEQLSAINRVKSARNLSELNNIMSDMPNNNDFCAGLSDNIKQQRESAQRLSLKLETLKTFMDEASALQASISRLAAYTHVSKNLEKTVRSIDVNNQNSILSGLDAVRTYCAEMKTIAQRIKDVETEQKLQAALDRILEMIERVRIERKNIEMNQTNRAKAALIEKLESIEAQHASASLAHFPEIAKRADNAIAMARKRCEVGDYEGLCRAEKDMLAISKEAAAAEAKFEEYLSWLNKRNELALELDIDALQEAFAVNAADKAINSLKREAEEYTAMLNINRRENMIQKAAYELETKGGYEVLCKKELADGTIEITYAKNGEGGTVQIVRADLNGHFEQLTVGVAITKNGRSMVSDPGEVEKICEKQLRACLSRSDELNRKFGLVSDDEKMDIVEHDSLRARELPQLMLSDTDEDTELMYRFFRITGFELCADGDGWKLMESETSYRERATAGEINRDGGKRKVVELKQRAADLPKK